MTAEPLWIDIEIVFAVHDQQIAEHGGGAGLRDRGLLESAMARPLNLVAYGEPDLATLAAAYGFGIARNHPFIDGNKRTAFIAIELFLRMNGQSFTASDVESVAMMLRLAAGELDEDALADWIRANSAPASS